MMNKLKSKIIWQQQKIIQTFRILNFKSGLKTYFNYFLNIKETQVCIKTNSEKIWIRTKNKIDLDVIEYVFYQKYHLPPEEFILKKNANILDIGSNIGATAIDFNRRFPTSNIFGFEMDIDNYNISLRNCKHYKNIKIANKPVWSIIESVYYNRQQPSDSFSISETNYEIHSLKIQTTTLKEIIFNNKLHIIDFLKMDIEGAEINIFNEKDLSWLDIVQSLNIEFHNITSDKLQIYIDILIAKNFIAYKSSNHWLSILAYKPNQ